MRPQDPRARRESRAAVGGQILRDISGQAAGVDFNEFDEFFRDHDESSRRPPLRLPVAMIPDRSRPGPCDMMQSRN
jgi:hypothetical protein